MARALGAAGKCSELAQFERLIPILSFALTRGSSAHWSLTFVLGAIPAAMCSWLSGNAASRLRHRWGSEMFAVLKDWWTPCQRWLELHARWSGLRTLGGSSLVRA